MHTEKLILQSAKKRFSDYGYSKTTMSEIAVDADMSVGNLYRHFKNKETLLLACLKHTIQKKLNAGIQAAEHCDNAGEAIEAFFLARLRIMHAQFSDTRHLYDLIEIIHNRHQNVLLDCETKTIDALTNILDRGVIQGEFFISDSSQTAYDLYQAMMRYNHPVALKNNPLNLLEEDLKRLLQLIYQGIKK
ncbi:MAG: TetR/AcrR family transcriptional regulator [Mariprofundaceae bacterium]|nr:TetR/AcrR family transcriptional regulator [Mariprofundaceae bacterium]